MEVCDIVRLNVGGETREISRNTLIKLPVFEAVFEHFNDTKELFVDRDVELFDDVIAYVAWGIQPASATQECQHYGICFSDAEEDSRLTETLAEALAEQILSEDSYRSGAFYISACGKMCATTRERLSEIGYFRGVFNRDMQLRQLYAGTQQEPYRTEIPAAVWQNIMAYLRDKRHKLIDKSFAVLTALGGLAKGPEDPDGPQGLEKDPAAAAATPAKEPIFLRTKTGGALMDLVAVGVANNAIDFVGHGAAECTLWRRTTKRYGRSSSARASIQATPVGGVANQHRVVIPRTADLLYKCYIRFRFAQNGLPFDASHLLAQDPALRFKLISDIRIDVGGQRIDELTGYQLMLLDKMPINCDNQNLDGFPIVHVPLFFSVDTGNALPIVSLQYHQVEMHITTAAATLPLFAGVQITPEILLTQVFLDQGERHMVQQGSFQYLLPLFERPIDFAIDQRLARGVNRFRLDFNHPTSAIYFTLHKDTSPESMYEPLTGQLIYWSLSLNGHDRSEGDEQTSMLDKIDTKINKHAPVYVIPFALEPLDRVQPTMSVNLSRIDNCEVSIQAQPTVGCVRFWSGYWNCLRVMNGMAGLAFAH